MSGRVAAAQGSGQTGAPTGVQSSASPASMSQPPVSPLPPIAGLRLRAPGDTLVLRPLPRFGILRDGLPYRADPALVADRIVRATRRQLAQALTARWVATVQAGLVPAAPPPARVVATDSGPTPGALVPLAPQRRGGADARTLIGGPDFLNNVGDLGINLTSTLESKLARTQNLRCTAAQITIIGNNCTGAFTPPSFDFQFNLRTGGVIADRVHVNVDYDSKREFDASNNINVYYEGKSDEILQRVEVGNVSFQPPASRFITSGIPAGNYGIQARGQLGPMRFTSIVAQQKGNVSKDNVFTVGDRTQQQVERAIEDIEISTRRFFFTVDPRQLRGYPNIDLLNRQQMQQLAASLPDSLRPTRVYVYRQRVNAANQNPRGPQFSVRGARNPSRQVYEVLRENVDYYLDPSQLWISLVTPLSPNNERLAVAYEVNNNGVAGRNINTGGTPDVEFTDAPQYANLLWEPELQPSQSEYFLREIKSIYQLGGEDLQRESLSLKLVTGISGDQEKPLDASRGETYLQMFGLAQATNPTAFDVENRVWPRPNDNNFSQVSGGRDKLIRNYFLFFPSLQPFARAGLAQPLANPANDTLYRYPNEYLYSTQRPQSIYRMVTRYLSEGGASQYSIRLQSQQVRPNSERVSLDGRVLQRDTDYKVDYELGVVTFTRGDTLFPNPRQVSVRYEENPLFASAPVTILGFSSQFPLDNGQVSFTAISQSQSTSLTRPPLGFEPNGSLVAGVTANMAWDATLLNRLVKKLPFGSGTAPSRVALQGEFAMSKPQPNSAGQAYVESFEGEAGVPISLSEAAWAYSSRPSLGTLLPSLVGASSLNLNRAATIAYQNNGVDSAGNYVQFSIKQIDPAVRDTGTGALTPEQLLWMTLYPLKSGGIFDFEPGTNKRRFAWTVGDNSMVGTTPTGRRWRSLRTVLNPSGADLSRIENLQFFVLVQAQAANIKKNPTLVFDFGEVSENSVTFAPETLTIAPPVRAGLKADTTYRGKRLVGYDRFDSERDAFSRAFNAVENDKGIAGDVADTIVIVDKTKSPTSITTANKVQLCTQSVAIVQLLGDSRAVCSARNNRLDEEDIDLDGQLNLTSANEDNESIRRYAVDLSDKRNWTRVGRCFAQRDSGAAGVVVSDSLCWVQVRLNWRAPLEALNSPNDRRMRAMRLTMISSGQAADDEFERIALAQLKLIGSPWLKRTDRPISGAAGDSSAVTAGYVIASVIGTLDSTSVLPYSAPPGVIEAPESLQSGYQNTRVQVNERALRLQAGIPGQQFRPFDRAEAFYRFPEGTKSFMGYRTLRLWMRGRGNGWGQNGELNGYVKVGRDEHNFYMYRTPVNTGPAQSAWDPEVKVDLTRFQILRAQLENNFLRNSADSLACKGVDLELIKRSGLPRGQTVRRYAVCQDGYIVYSADPSVTPPNLAGVQELSVGMVRVDSVPKSGSAILANDTLELWVDDVRLTDVVDDIGFAGELGLSLNAGALADFRLNLSRRDPNFRQLGENPSFLTTSGVSVGTTVHLERMLPASLGLVIPMNIDYAGSAVDPLFLNRSDVRASGIDNLRNPKDRRINYSMSMRRATPLTHGWYAPVLNGLALSGAWSNGSTQSAFQEGTTSNYVMGATLDMSDDRRESHLPKFIDKLFDLLPKRWRESDAIRNTRAQNYRWAPTQFRLTSSLARNANSLTSFTKAASSPTDTGQLITGLTHAWVNSARVEFRPSLGLTGSIDARQVLDLRDYRDLATTADSTDRRQAAAAERLRFLGSSLGLEQERNLTSGVLFQPQISQWLQPRLDFRSTFRLAKDPNARALLREGDSTGAFRLPKRLGAAQSFTAATQVNLSRLFTDNTANNTLINRFGKLFAPADVSWSRDLTSNYDNTVFDPGLGYQFGVVGIDAFRGLRNAQLASTAGRVQNFSTIGALNLPLSVNVQSRFEKGTSETWTRRALDGFQALITSDRRTYPDISLRWSWRPTTRVSKVLSMVSLSPRYVITEQQTVVPNESGSQVDRSNTSSRTQSVPWSLTWAFLGNLTTTGSVDLTHREDSRPGSESLADTKRMSFELARSFPLPKKWNTRTGKLRSRLSYQSEETVATVGGTTSPDAATAPSTPTLSVLNNSGRRAFNLNADTDVSDLVSFSMTGSHILTFDRNYNRRQTNMVLSVLLTIRFTAGELR